MQRDRESTKKKNNTERKKEGKAYEGLDKKTALLMKDYEVLTQQVDERMRHVWNLGAIFVPLSFLIFAYAVTSEKNMVDPVSGKILLMFASLTCYFVWFALYLRNRKYNQPSYDRIHKIEEKLGLYAYKFLDDVRKAHWITRRSKSIFVVASFSLVILWGLLFLPQILILFS
nr:hypothetical protein [Candidatus Njordarchaeum guaymaensis]